MSEYWIRSDGDVDFADGDIGDMNHEGIVIQDVQRNIIDKAESAFGLLKKSWNGNLRSFSDDEYIDWDEFKRAIAAAYADQLMQEHPKKKKKYKALLKEDPNKFVVPAIAYLGTKEAEWSVAEGGMDARDFAMEYWGWKTYRDGHIDTWRFTRNDLKAIVRGIDNIADEMGWSEKKLERMSFGITVFSNRKSFSLSYRQMTNPRMPSAQPDPIKSNLVNFNQHTTDIAKNQVRDMELQKLDPYYQKRTFPFGDSVISFRDFLLL